MLPPLLLAVASLVQAREVDTGRARVGMPAQVVKVFEEEAHTPWGNTRRKDFACTDQQGIVYLFSSHTFKRPVRLEARRLSSVRQYFLRNRGCVAKDRSRPRLRDADGRIWPQAQFGGVCEGTEGFRILVFIADGDLYQLQVMVDGTFLHRNFPGPGPETEIPPGILPPPPPPPPSARDLQQAMNWFMGQFHSKGGPRS